MIKTGLNMFVFTEDEVELLRNIVEIISTVPQKNFNKRIKTTLEHLCFKIGTRCVKE